MEFHQYKHLLSVRRIFGLGAAEELVYEGNRSEKGNYSIVKLTLLYR
jgi:hypothetical protein